MNEGPTTTTTSIQKPMLVGVLIAENNSFFYEMNG